jgi:hypothetical protein
MSDTNYDPEAVISEQAVLMQEAYTQLYLIQLTNLKRSIRKGEIDSGPILKRLRAAIRQRQISKGVEPIQ